MEKRLVADTWVMVDVFVSELFFQVPGSISPSLIEEIKDFIKVINENEKGSIYIDYPFIVDVLDNKQLENYTFADLEDVEYVLEEISKIYKEKDF